MLRLYRSQPLETWQGSAHCVVGGFAGEESIEIIVLTDGCSTKNCSIQGTLHYEPHTAECYNSLDIEEWLFALCVSILSLNNLLLELF